MPAQIHCTECDQVVPYPHRVCPGRAVADAARAGFNTLVTDSGATAPAKPKQSPAAPPAPPAPPAK